MKLEAYISDALAAKTSFGGRFNSLINDIDSN